ncbi:MAG: rhomboid family intramembrane serine protease [Cyclobacteriaceae bacterium]
MFSRMTPMVKNILIINVVVLLLSNLISIDVVDVLGLRYIFASSFKPYQLFTYMWMHGGIWHLIGNMFAVFIFGPMLEQIWGPKKFLAFYLITGVGAGMLYATVNYIEVSQVQNASEVYIQNPDPEAFNYFITEHAPRFYNRLFDFINEYAEQPGNPQYISESKAIANQIYESKANIPMVGASGAVFGILMAFAMMFPNMELMLLFPPIPVKAKYLVMFYGAYELYSEINRSAGDNVAHFAHLSGMLIAFLILKYWQKNSGSFY